MSKYFKRYEDNTLTYPEDVSFIRKTIEEKYGILTCSNHKLENLWRKFSNTYEAGFLIPSEELIEHFIYWLEEQE